MDMCLMSSDGSAFLINTAGMFSYVEAVTLGEPSEGANLRYDGRGTFELRPFLVPHSVEILQNPGSSPALSAPQLTPQLCLQGSLPSAVNI
ncbi:hypothetical protein CRENBAI_002778 [Crenichthys baileyi]|uniref:Uncharacterized protein n=1 Tax=Crenichthys baileyi TaxID=28760 RepID=A0AAV9QX19_9TELE